MIACLSSKRCSDSVPTCVVGCCVAAMHPFVQTAWNGKLCDLSHRSCVSGVQLTSTRSRQCSSPVICSLHAGTARHLLSKAFLLRTPCLSCGSSIVFSHGTFSSIPASHRRRGMDQHGPAQNQQVQTPKSIYFEPIHLRKAIMNRNQSPKSKRSNEKISFNRDHDDI